MHSDIEESFSNEFYGQEEFESQQYFQEDKEDQESPVSHDSYRNIWQVEPRQSREQQFSNSPSHRSFQKKLSKRNEFELAQEFKYFFETASNKIQAQLYHQLITNFKQEQKKVPFWISLNKYKLPSHSQRTHDFMKHLSYQLFLILEGQEYVTVEDLPELMINEHNQAIANEYFNRDNIKKRNYDILNTFEQVNFVQVKQKYKNGKAQKKNRAYRIHPDWRKRRCVNQTHFVRYKELLKEKILFLNKSSQILKKQNNNLIKVLNNMIEGNIEQQEYQSEVEVEEEEIHNQNRDQNYQMDQEPNPEKQMWEDLTDRYINDFLFQGNMQQKFIHNEEHDLIGQQKIEQENEKSLEIHNFISNPDIEIQHNEHNEHNELNELNKIDDCLDEGNMISFTEYRSSVDQIDQDIYNEIYGDYFQNKDEYKQMQPQNQNKSNLNEEYVDLMGEQQKEFYYQDDDKQLSVEDSLQLFHSDEEDMPSKPEKKKPNMKNEDFNDSYKISRVQKKQDSPKNCKLVIPKVKKRKQYFLMILPIKQLNDGKIVIAQTKQQTEYRLKRESENQKMLVFKSKELKNERLFTPNDMIFRNYQINEKKRGRKRKGQKKQKLKPLQNIKQGRQMEQQRSKNQYEL